MSQNTSPKSSSPQRSEAALKQERLAEALRANLKRRKSQKRGRSAVQADASPTSATPDQISKTQESE